MSVQSLHGSWLRFVVQQYTNAELRQRVRHGHGLVLQNDRQARAWKCMAYGVLRDRARRRFDRRLNDLKFKRDAFELTTTGLS